MSQMSSFQSAEFNPEPKQVVLLTPEQSAALNAGPGPVEIQNHDGTTLGYLVSHPDITLFYTPQQLAELQKRARAPQPGRSLNEILRSAEKSALCFVGSR